MKKAEIAAGILEDIRAELRDLSARVGATNMRIDDLGRRFTEAEGRTATALVELAGAVRELLAAAQR